MLHIGVEGEKREPHLETIQSIKPWRKSGWPHLTPKGLAARVLFMYTDLSTRYGLNWMSARRDGSDKDTRTADGSWKACEHFPCKRPHTPSPRVDLIGFGAAASGLAVRPIHRSGCHQPDHQLRRLSGVAMDRAAVCRDAACERLGAHLHQYSERSLRFSKKDRHSQTSYSRHVLRHLYGHFGGIGQYIGQVLRHAAGDRSNSRTLCPRATEFCDHAVFHLANT